MMPPPTTKAAALEVNRTKSSACTLHTCLRSSEKAQHFDNCPPRCQTGSSLEGFYLPDSEQSPHPCGIKWQS